MAAEIDLAPDEMVSACQVDGRAGNAEGKRRKVDNTFFHVKVAAEIGDGAACIVVSRLALRTAAERLQRFTDFRAGPACVVDADLAVENHLIQHFFFSWRQQ